jgi:hypothetical protein
MAEKRPLSQYILTRGRADEETEALHELVQRYREEFFENHVLQDVLLNRGDWIPDEERPGSFLEIPSVVILHEQTRLHLSYVELMIEKATKPVNVYVSAPRSLEVGDCGVLLPNCIEDREISLQTADEIPYENIELVQRGWFEHPHVVETVRKYQAALSETFDEFNLQMVLGRIERGRSVFTTDDEKQAVVDEIAGRWNVPSYHALDSAYYEMGRRMFGAAGQLWQELDEHEYGQLFRLEPEELRREAGRRQIMD